MATKSSNTTPVFRKDSTHSIFTLIRSLGTPLLLTVGSNFHDNQISVGLNHTKDWQFLNATTNAHAHVTNVAGYVQQGLDLLGQKLHFDAGMRFDYFRFDVDDHLVFTNSG